MHNKIRHKRNANRKFYPETWYEKVPVLKPGKPPIVIFALVVFFLILIPSHGNTIQTPTPGMGSITVNAQNVVRLRPYGVGGINITSHNYGLNFLNGKNGVDFQADARVAKVPLIRSDAYPDNSSTIGVDFYDRKIKAILGTGAQPILECAIGSSIDSPQPTGELVGPY